MRSQTAGNAEVTWLVYAFSRQPGGGYRMGDPLVQHTLWEDVVDALREGRPPERGELLADLTRRAEKLKRFST